MNQTRKNALAYDPAKQGTDFRASFKFGRKTAAWGCQYLKGRLPDTEVGCPEVERVYVRNLGLHRPEAAALMGARWGLAVRTRFFNNDYFVSMVTKGWMHNPMRTMWRRSDAGRNEPGLGHEMMLNADLCLAYAEEGVPVNSRRDDCCAWMNPPTTPGMGVMPEAIANNAGLICGKPPTLAGTKTRRNCCDLSRTKADPSYTGDPDTEDDCGSPDTLQGYAAKAVMTFAADEAAWLRSFQAAWTKVTENGHHGLKDLGQC